MDIYVKGVAENPPPSVPNMTVGGRNRQLECIFVCNTESPLTPMFNQTTGNAVEKVTRCSRQRQLFALVPTRNH